MNWRQRTHSGKGHDGDKGEGEAQRSIPVEEMRDEAEGNKYKKDIQVRAKEEELV